MKIFKDKQGNKLTFKEFIEKWKSGIEEITLTQKTNTQILGLKIMLLGLFLGLIMSLIRYKTMWWVSIILIGGLINTFIQYISLIQQKKAFENLEINSVDLTDVKTKLDELFDKEEVEGGIKNES